jgi:hypothetical protein
VAWTVTLAPPARKALKAIRDTRLCGRIVRALQGLEADPRPAGVKRLVGQERGAAAFYALKADLEEQVRQSEAGLAKPFDPRAFEPRAFR